MLKLLSGKRALIVGIASHRSIASGIAQVMESQGAELILTYQNDRFKSRVEEMGEKWKASGVFPCDVARDDSIHTLFQEIGRVWDGIDILVHSVAFAPPGELGGDYIASVTREGFRVAHDVSSYSFSALAKAGLKLMEGRRASLLTLTYMGSERAFPSYNVMGLAKASLEANVRYMAMSLGLKGIRVNAISAGPLKTLAAVGVGSFRKMLAYSEKTSPLQRNVTLEEVGYAAAFLCSDWASGITGEIVHVDCGLHGVGMPPNEDLGLS
ncbi:MAG: enoyl-ACP reductase [Gammaproteobacteria bacterium]|nr:enoyl-ACP reductase [Gammaproteobacteria bacterium]